MESVIQILMLFIVVNTVLKSSFWRWWQSALFGILCAIFVVVSCQWAILQSKTQLADYWSNQTVMQNMTVLITIESLLCVAFCFNALKITQTKKRKRAWAIALHRYPGLLLFPVLFYLLTQTIYTLPGSDFTTISYAFAATVLIGIPLLSRLVKQFCPETELRLEVHFLTGLFVCVTGLITTVNGNVTYAAAGEAFNGKALLLPVGLFLIMFLAGMFLDKGKWLIFSKKQKTTK